MKMASLAILFPCAMVLVGTAVAVVVADRDVQRSSIPARTVSAKCCMPSPRRETTTAVRLPGLGANTPFYNGLLGLAMLVGRFWVMLPVLAIAGSLAAKKTVPAGPGTLPTHTPLFVVLLVAVVIVVGALSFFPALALGPIVEHLLTDDGELGDNYHDQNHNHSFSTARFSAKPSRLRSGNSIPACNFAIR